MKNYRIVKHTNVNFTEKYGQIFIYTIEKRFLFFFWCEHLVYHDHDGTFSNLKVDRPRFKTIEEATAYIETNPKRVISHYNKPEVVKYL